MTQNILIIAVKQRVQTREQFDSSVEELKSLSDTAGGTVKEVFTQNRTQIHPATYIGKGKIEEITESIDELEIDLIISNDELSPGQSRNLSNHFDISVIDRSQLILDIFAKRAHTKEGKLQVELAQLEYLLPRLHGQGLLLSRLGGGIGTRGPGETQLEIDQRHIRRRIHDIKRRLKQVVAQRDQYRERRRQNKVFQIAIVGYTNAGKSTLFNQLTEGNELVEDQLFATLDPLSRKIQLPSGFRLLITDTVGFLQELPTTLIAAFRSTLEEVTEADFILHVVDAEHHDKENQQQTVLDLLGELEADNLPRLTVYNKKDRIDTDNFIPNDYPNILISAHQKDDMGRMLLKVEEILKQEWNKYHITLHPSRGDMLHRLQQETIVTNREFDTETDRFVIDGFIRPDDPLQSILSKEEEERHDR